MNDKALHFIAGFIIALIIAFLSSPLIGFGVSLLAGIAKEMWDSHGHGTVDKNDVIATVFGGAVGSLIVFIVNLVN